MGAIVRTAGVGRAAAELQWDLDNLKTPVGRRSTRPPRTARRPFLVYRESDAVTRALRDYLADDIGEVLVDDDATFANAQEYMTALHAAPRRRSASSVYTDDVPLFTRFQIESQIESAYAHKVELPSGGIASSIDYTEALVSIDINSARATRGADIETTATNTNLEAADEIARQLRIRDIGGLIVIDFIDMESHEEPARRRRPAARRREDGPRPHPDRPPVALRPARDVAPAPASLARRVQPPRLPALQRHRQHPFSVESMALAILRLIGEEARKDKHRAVIAQVPVEVATYLMNEKREWLRTLEDKSARRAHDRAEPAHRDAGILDPARARRRGRAAREQGLSYRMPTRPGVARSPTRLQPKPPAAPAAAVAAILPTTPAPITSARHPWHLCAKLAAAPVAPVVDDTGSFWGRVRRWFNGGDPAPAAAPHGRGRGEARGRIERRVFAVHAAAPAAVVVAIAEVAKVGTASATRAAADSVVAAAVVTPAVSSEGPPARPDGPRGGAERSVASRNRRVVASASRPGPQS